ncbi:MAG: phosphoribosylformylglycinamidine synthase [Phycisphaerales bacterium]
MAQHRRTLILAGQAAFSAFRLEAQRHRLRAAGVPVRGLAARHLYVASVDAGWTDDHTTRLRTLLPADLPDWPAEAPPGPVVVPRLGTVSPWSSKAEDIARNCGLPHLQRLEQGVVWAIDADDQDVSREALLRELHDPMTESVLADASALPDLFETPPAGTLRRVNLGGDPLVALTAANRDWGLALSPDEIDYLAREYARLDRSPTDAELVMFAQINSEHCRHKIFNAGWTIDGQAMPASLFRMIQASHAASPEGVLSAYKDNAAVVTGATALRFFAGADRSYRGETEPVHLVMKVETHNHPTAIAPDPGAATGCGGEIRDEAATGRGARTKAGLCGFSVSNLRLPGYEQPWEIDHGRPQRVASARQIMLEAPIGAARYNNEFGRPNLTGYFRTFEKDGPDGLRGYHKPIMIAGGMGNIRGDHVEKQPVSVDARLIVLGGPAMRIGLGGGAASSMASGRSSEALDFASVQRANPEMERRCQEVIDGCWAMGDSNPIASIHDVGAGGLSNALPEIIDADGRGASIRLRDIHSADASLSPMEIWCNEAQERYVLAVAADSLSVFEALCRRERCPMAVVGEAIAEPHLQVRDNAADAPVDMPMPVLLGKTPKMHREGRRPAPVAGRPLPEGVNLQEAAYRVLRLPTVADKSFLITIGDRSIGGQVAREQMVGPWQVPVADCAVTTTGFTGTSGEAMAMGERAPLAVLDAPASGRMAVAEALTNLAAARIERLSDVRLSANWMAACGDAEEDARLFDTVRAVGEQLCPALGIAIPVGKDSLSMRTIWEQDGQSRDMRAPVSLIVSAFAPALDAGATLTPQLRQLSDSRLILLAPNGDQARLGGSALAQVYGVEAGPPPDVDNPATLRALFDIVQSLNAAGRILAYHDRSDGGLWATLCEMAFAGRTGLEVDLGRLAGGPLAALFNEEPAAVIQVAAADAAPILGQCREAGLAATDLGVVAADRRIRIHGNGDWLLDEDRIDLHRAWSETSYRLKALRDDPDCAREEYDALLDADDPGLPAAPGFDPAEDPAAPFLNLTRPRVAILREQGVNGHLEMAWAFHAAGFEAVDVHMSELLAGSALLRDFQGLAACGGFSYGDVLGAGRGWAGTILNNPALREAFAAFFADERNFALGVCNGCQMLSHLADLIPGTDDWPTFLENRSAQFEARTVAVEVLPSRSVLLDGMAGARVPIAVAHGEGRVVYADDAAAQRLTAAGQLSLRYVDNAGGPAARYPANPNGSPGGATGFCNVDGRVLILMPHPERVTRTITQAWRPAAWSGERAPWARLFANARRFSG